MKAVKWIILGVVILALILGGVYQNSRIERLEEEVHKMAEFRAVGVTKHSELTDISTPHVLADLVAAVCSETEADTKIRAGILGNFGTWAKPRSTYIVGNYAYCIYLHGMFIADISDKDNPSIVGSLGLGDNQECVDILVDGSYAYISQWGTLHRLNVVDISTPSSPSLTGSVSDGTQLLAAHGIAKTGNYIIVGAFSGDRLTIVDVSNPAAPSITSSLYDAAQLNGIHDVQVSNDGNLAYVACHYSGTGGEGGFTIVDISNKSVPSVRSHIHSAALCSAADIQIKDIYAYLANRVINISDSYNPVDVGGITPPPDYWYSLAIYGDLLYGVSVDYLYVYDISTPTSPALQKRFMPSTGKGFCFHVCLTTDGKYAVVAVAGEGIDGEPGKFYIIETEVMPYATDIIIPHSEDRLAHTAAIGYGYLWAAFFNYCLSPSFEGNNFLGQNNVVDGNTATASYVTTVNGYASYYLPAALHISKFRHYGNVANNGDGVWKLEYMDVANNWHNWVTGISTRATADWSDWDSSGGHVVAIAIRLTCTTLDSAGSSYINELEITLR